MPKSAVLPMVIMMTVPPADLSAELQRWLTRQHWFRLLCRRARAGTSQIFALSGAQGSGKSTLAAMLAAQLQQTGLETAVVSLDDYYHSKARRLQLAADVHPLLRWRGVPGTHQIERLRADLQRHLQGEAVRWPVFDKAADDSAAERPAVRSSLLILEGWCLGALPQSVAELACAQNELEQQHDQDGRFRHYVNQQLALHYQPLWALLPAMLFLAAPDWQTVLGWRAQQEKALWQQRGRGMAPAELQFFMQLFQRYSSAMLKGQLSAGAHRVQLSADRRPLG